MTPDDKAVVASLRTLQSDAGRLADEMEAGSTPWPGELQDRVHALQRQLEFLGREVQRRRPRVTRGRSW